MKVIAATTEGAPTLVEDGPVRVKIYKRTKTVNGSAYAVFEVADFSEGTRKMRSFSDEAEALNEAKRIAGLMRRGDSEGLRLDGQDRAVYVRAVQHLKPVGIPLDIAAVRIADAIKIMGGDFILDAAKHFAKRNPARLPKKTVAEAVKEFIAAKTGAGRSERHIQDLEYRLQKLSDAFQCPLSSVSGDMLQTWIDGLKLSPRSKDHFRNKASTLFRWCQRRGYLPKDWDELDRLEKVKLTDSDVTVFTSEEASKLLSAADKDFLPSLAIQLFAGLRTAEVERLTWADVNLPEKFITIKSGTAKTASRRVVPIVDALSAWLSPYARHTGRIWKGGKTTICDGQKEASKASKVAWKKNAPRHSFISYRLADIKNVNQVALEAGNSAAMIFKHYRELVRETDAKRYFGILPERPANVSALGKAVAIQG